MPVREEWEMPKGLRRFATVIVGGLAGAALAAGSVRAQSDDLPEAPGKDAVVQTCTLCHAAGMITQRRRSPEEWSAVITRMKGLGAAMDDQTQAAIQSYLAANLSNGATPADAAPATPAAPPTGSPAATTPPAGTPSTPPTPRH